MLTLETFPAIITNRLKPNSSYCLVASFKSVERASTLFLNPCLVLCNKIREQALTLSDGSGFRPLKPVVWVLCCIGFDLFDLFREKEVSNALCSRLEGTTLVIDKHG